MSFKAPWCKSRSRGRRTHRYTGLCQRQPKGSQNSREKKNTWRTRGGKSGETHPYLPPHAGMLRVKSCTCQFSAQLGLRIGGQCRALSEEGWGMGRTRRWTAPPCACMLGCPEQQATRFSSELPGPWPSRFLSRKGSSFPHEPSLACVLN